MDKRTANFFWTILFLLFAGMIGFFVASLALFSKWDKRAVPALLGGYALGTAFLILKHLLILAEEKRLMSPIRIFFRAIGYALLFSPLLATWWTEGMNWKEWWAISITGAAIGFFFLFLGREKQTLQRKEV